MRVFLFNLLLWSFLLLCFLPVQVISQNDSTIEIDSVTVNRQTNQIEIFWTIEGDDISSGFVRIHRAGQGDNTEPIAEIDDPYQGYYLDEQVDASLEQFRYFVSLHEPDGTSIVQSDVHGTIFLEDATPDVCASEILLQWDNYFITESDGPADSLEVHFDKIQVFSSLNEGDFRLLTEADYGPETVIVTDIIPGEYDFFIRAAETSSGFSSSSNTFSIGFETLEPPSFLNLQAVDVVSGQYIQLRLDVDENVIFPSYIIYRSDSPDDGFITVDTITDNFYDDHSADPGLNQWYYKTTALDSCLMHPFVSETVSSLYLNGEQPDLYTNVLRWSFDHEWQNGVKSYEILRRLPSENDFSSVAFLNGNSDYYEDDLNIIPPYELSGDILYKILAIEEGGFDEEVNSNVLLMNREDDIFVPNAFRPSSEIAENREFKPSFSFFTPDEYQLQVFNRWGQQIFSSKEPEIGWDGQGFPAGVYAWVISFINNSGNEIEKRGIVKLIR